MANVRLFGETSGFVELAAPNAAGNNTITLPTTGTELVASDATGDITFAGTVTASGLVVDSSGRLLVGTSTARSADFVTASIQNEGTTQNNSSIQLTCNSAASVGTAAELNFSRSRGSAVGDNDAATNGDVLGIINFTGADGTDLNSVAAQIRGVVDADTGSNDMPGRLVFYTTADGASSSTERMRITSSGHVGIDASSPSTLLQIGDGSTGNGVPQLRLHRGSGSDYLNIDCSGGSSFFDQVGGGNIRLATGGTERARLLSNGHIGFGCTARLGQGGIFFRQNTSNGAAEFTWNRADTALDSFVMLFHNNTNTVGSISHDNVSTAYNTSSDYRLKENIVDLDGAIDRVKQLLPRRFNFLANPAKTVDGFIAHEAQTVVPEAVKGTHNELQVWQEGEELPDGVSIGDNKLDEDGNTIPKYQGIDQSKLVPLLTAALQEAIGKIEALETANASLEARLTALESA